MTDCDVLVVGGGPAGLHHLGASAEKGWKVTVLEKDHHPRFHIGESLLPLNLPDLRAAGRARSGRGDRHQEAGRGFQLGDGGGRAIISSISASRSTRVSRTPTRSGARTSINLLLKNSAKKGTNVSRACKVTGVEFPKDGNPVVHTVDENGDKRDMDVPLLRRRLGPRHAAGPAVRLKRRTRTTRAPRCSAISQRGTAGGRVRGEHQRLLVRARLVLDDPAPGRDDERRRRVPAGLPQAAKGSIPEYLLETIAKGHPEMRTACGTPC